MTSHAGDGTPGPAPEAARLPDPGRGSFERGVTCWVCPDCAFTFDAIHTDEPNGGYTCPACFQDAALRAELGRAGHPYTVSMALDAVTVTEAATWEQAADELNAVLAPWAAEAEIANLIDKFRARAAAPDAERPPQETTDG